MIWSVSWRNIWRNPRRSLILISAVAVGMFAGVFSITFYKGWMEQRMKTGVETEVSYLQMHKPGFLGNYDPELFMPDGMGISQKLMQISGIDGASPRIVVQSMVSSAENSTGIKIIGINPELEKTTSNLFTYMKEGDFFTGEVKNPAVIGDKLASRLGVRLNSRIVVTLQDMEGNLVNGAFRIIGIFNISNNFFEETNLFVKYDDLQRLTAIPQKAAHEITIHLKNPKSLIDSKNAIISEFPGMETLHWKEMNPELGFLSEYGDMFMYIIIVIILLALGFGIVNTMLMSVLERIKELGMLMAVGMSKFRIFWMLMLETVLLTFTGGISGIVIGIIATMATARNGINLSMYAEGLEDIGYASHIYPVFDLKMVASVAILVIMTGIIASVYPARKALKYPPAEALRTDM